MITNNRNEPFHNNKLTSQKLFENIKNMFELPLRDNFKLIKKQVYHISYVNNCFIKKHEICFEWRVNENMYIINTGVMTNKNK